MPILLPMLICAIDSNFIFCFDFLIVLFGLYPKMSWYPFIQGVKWKSDDLICFSSHIWILYMLSTHPRRLAAPILPCALCCIPVRWIHLYWGFELKQINVSLAGSLVIVMPSAVAQWERHAKETLICFELQASILMARTHELPFKNINNLKSWSLEFHVSSFSRYFTNSS